MLSVVVVVLLQWEHWTVEDIWPSNVCEIVSLMSWSIPRALQKINKAKRLEGEAVMSAPPFFQSAGQGDLK